jgi:hypothetical protein
LHIKKKKLTMKKIFLTLPIFLLFFSGCIKENKPVDNELQVFNTIDKLFKAFEDRDTTSHDSLWFKSPELVVFGLYDKSEFFGWDETRKHLVTAAKTMQGAHFAIKCKEIRMSPSKTTAWFAVIADQDYQTAAGVFENNNIRYTGVLEKKGSRWLIVQFHGSLPKIN